MKKPSKKPAAPKKKKKAIAKAKAAKPVKRAKPKAKAKAAKPKAKAKAKAAKPKAKAKPRAKAKAAPKKAKAKAAPKKAKAKAVPKQAKAKAAPKPVAEPEVEAGANVENLWRSGPRAEELGVLEIPSGKVKVCDAGTLFAPVEVTLPKGTYEVRITRGDGNDNAAAVLAMKGATPVTWIEVGSYGVDAGMAGFFDSDVFARVDKHVWPISIYDDLICNHLDPAEDEGHAGAFVPYEETKFSACRSGMGDGVYPVFEGRDAQGLVVAIVTTF